MKIWMKGICFTLLGLVALVYGLLYFLQERLIFFPEVLAADHQFRFADPFEEVWLEAQGQVQLHGLLFSKPQAKGIVLFLHGNAGSLDSWGDLAPLYLKHGYDVFFLDYRGYGKSQGKIKSEKQLVEDAQLAYDWLKMRYPDSKLIISGTSIGTGIATRLAAQNQVDLLMLNSPYAGLKDLIREKYPIVPSFLIKYQLSTQQYIEQVKAPIVLFHGQKDQLIPPSHAQKLKKQRVDIELHLSARAGHNDLAADPQYLNALREVLNEMP